MSKDAPCFICSGISHHSIIGLEVNQHTFHECEGCGIVTAHPENPSIKSDFSDYGEYLINNKKEIQTKIFYAERTHKKFFKEVRRRYGKNAHILDFGAGAGYFLKAAQSYGFSISGYELSEKLIVFSKKELGITLTNKIDNLRNDYDVICMFDVIEHISPDIFRVTIDKLLQKLKHGGILYGNTPNYRSLNIIICGDKDPVIAPPSHICYFTTGSLDLCLKSFGLHKISLTTKGMSSNSFFRKSKFSASFLEINPKNVSEKWILHYPLKCIFKIIGNILSATKFGYQIYFKYKYI